MERQHVKFSHHAFPSLLGSTLSQTFEINYVETQPLGYEVMEDKTGRKHHVMFSELQLWIVRCARDIFHSPFVTWKISSSRAGMF
ncbi:hypothetical protein RSOLAG1IB_06953 [Rhizoctonia solani AG-1 IB]|uniref:Uncharacterized protein n=1 Tax=Thanatephorus cucumeris (strain AG1-IB / isolate 7/3/14) TaxID=1108050 RepID=A0A0B7F9T5_THACB|nr:hypothetical protein RSOLAG1IB_06953 [Rhizoctonia solani AG-1 IB]